MASDEPPARTTYDLRTVSGGTELTLTSEAFEGARTAKMSKSGQFIADNVKSLSETGNPTFGGRIVMLMSPIMSLLTPAGCKVRDWPLSRVPLGAIER